MKTKEFRSEFDNDVIVSIIDNNDFRYSVIKPLFESYGFGFMIPANISEKLMLIDQSCEFYYLNQLVSF